MRNIKVIENAKEVYNNMQVIKRPQFGMIPSNLYTVLEYAHGKEKHVRILLDYDNVFQRTKSCFEILMENITLKCEVQKFWF